jgi:hypothetical protein
LGNQIKDLFKELYKWNWEENYPVIKVDFSEIGHEK